MSEEFDVDEELKKINADLTLARADISVTQITVETNFEEMESLKAQEEAIAETLRQVKEKRRKAQEEHQINLRKMRELRNKQLDMDRRVQMLLQEKKNRELLDAKSHELDVLTANSRWRQGFVTPNGKLIKAKYHQIEGAKRLAVAGRAVLGDRRGLGKTGTSIIFMEMSRAKKTLIFVPKDVSKNFESEIQNWAPDRPVIVMTGMDQVTRRVVLMGLKVSPEFTVIINYEAWRRDATLLEDLIACQFDTVIIDEAHNIKNTGGIAFQGISDLIYAENKCGLCGHDKFGTTNDPAKRPTRYCLNCRIEQVEFGDFCSVRRVLPMTGTKVLNRPDDMWALLYLIDKISFPSRNKFLNDYCTQDLYTGRWKFRYGGEEALLKKLGMKYTGRTPESAGVEMPPQDVTHHFINFDPIAYPDQAKVISQVRKGAIKMAEKVALTVPGMLAQITRMSQALVWPGGIQIKDPETGVVLYTAPATNSVKLDKAVEIILQAIEEGDRVVLFSRFKEALKELEIRLKAEDIRVVRYDGDISDARAREVQLDFDVKTASKTDYKYQVILAQYQKASTGLNLNAARQMVILDRYWSPGREDQAGGRIQRMDTEHSTIVHLITVEFARFQSIDVWMNALIEGKTQMLEGLDAQEEIHLSNMFEEFINQAGDF